MTLTETKRKMLEEIQKARNLLKIDIINGVITEDDIMGLLRVKGNYGFKYKDRIHAYKSSVLRNIFNCPFILCDQEDLSFVIKKTLPFLLNARYEMEIEELNSQLELNYISEDEYIEKKKILKFCYYESSIDGKSVLKTGHVNNVIDNKIRVK